MFTGIVEELGAVRAHEKRADGQGGWMRLTCRDVLADIELGVSIAVNGCCLTVVDWDIDAGWFGVDVTDESYLRTDLAELAPGDPVNLERSVRAQDRLGGHLVQGHIDGIGEIVSAAPDLEVTVPDALGVYLVEKGSVTIDGISLTIVEPGAAGFTVAVIPHTTEVTTLGRKGPGDRVNIEVDVMAKYAEKLLAGHTDHGEAS